MNLLTKATGLLFATLVGAAAVATYKPTSAVQLGNPGLGMEVVQTKAQLAERVAANAVPEALPPASENGQLAVDAYKNVRVLGHISSGELTRLMTAMTTWVAPDAGCGYCHAPQRDASGNILKNEDGYSLADPNKMDSDELYTKVVARRMLQMTMRINGDWKQHVKETGVTCYTCHRGNPVPKQIWFDEPPNEPDGALGNKAGQNAPSLIAGLTSLPGSSLRPFLAGDENIRIQSTEAVGSENRASIKEAEWTYSLMMHISTSLGVNCTFCHNTRSMGVWDSSPSPRAQAWYGIRMVRDLNHDFLEPLASTFPPQRLGPQGDGPKVNCATCHQGAYRPLLGVSMLTDYRVLAEAKPQPTKAPEAAPAPSPSAVPSAEVPATAPTDVPSATPPPSASASAAASSTPSSAPPPPSAAASAARPPGAASAHP